MMRRIRLGIELIDGIGIEGDVVTSMVQKEGLEVFLAIPAEKECVDSRTKTLERPVGGGKEGASLVARGVVEQWIQTGLLQSKAKGAEFTRKCREDINNLGRWKKKAVDSVNNTVGSKDVDGNHSGVEVECEASEGDLAGNALRHLANGLSFECCRDGTAGQDSPGWVEFGGDVVCEKLLQELFGRLWGVLRDLFEGSVSGCEDGIVCLRAIEKVHEIRELIDGCS
jgi:hypothetical protein